MSHIISNKRLNRNRIQDIHNQIDSHNNYRRDLASKRLEEEEQQRKEHQVEKGELFEFETPFYGKIVGRIANPNTSSMILSLGNGYDGHSSTLKKADVRQLIDKLSKLHENMTDHYTPPEPETANEHYSEQSDYYDSDD